MTYGKDDIISVANMYFKADSYITDESYLLTYNIFELGDIAFEGNKSKNYAHGRFVENTIGNGIVSHVFDVFKPIMKPYDLQFWKYAINNEQLMGGILLRSTKAYLPSHILLGQEFGLKKPSMVLLEQLQTVNKDELRDYIGTIKDEQLLRRINITLKKTFGLWIYKEEKKENIRCLCSKCLKDYIHNPDYIVRRLDPFAKVKDHCDKCNQSGWDYVIAERQHNAREKGCQNV